MPTRHFVKYTFLQVDPAWRRLDDEQRAADKREFLAACEDFADGHLLRSFSLVGTRGDADLMLLSQAQNLERIHEFHVVLAQSGLMKWCTVPYSLLAMTKPSEYSDESRLEVRPAHGKYLFVYPFVKTRAWYLLSPEERWRIMQEHIKLGREYPSIELNTSYSFGLDDQEFVVAFETDNPADFLDLVQRLRTTESSSLHAARHPDVHLHLVLGRAGAGRARRHGDVAQRLIFGVRFSRPGRGASLPSDTMSAVNGAVGGTADGPGSDESGEKPIAVPSEPETSVATAVNGRHARIRQRYRKHPHRPSRPPHPDVRRPPGATSRPAQAPRDPKIVPDPGAPARRSPAIMRDHGAEVKQRHTDQTRSTAPRCLSSRDGSRYPPRPGTLAA